MKAVIEDVKGIIGPVKTVWSEYTEEQLNDILTDYINSEESAIFVSKQDELIIGAALCSLHHDYVEGCETSPVGYLEGISVLADYRKQGIAKQLVEECEQWAREKGCSEFASDCKMENTDSLNFHLKIGFTEQNRIIHFKKNL